MPPIGPLVALLFFVSGASGLIYEVLWTRQLGLIFGVSTYAIATVLATFMGGLALGSYLGGQWVDRARSPLRIYAILEAGVGLYALALPMLFAGLRPLYISLYGLDVSYAVFSFGRAVLAGLVLLVPTTLMGATFPVLVRFWVRSHDDVGRGTGLLYFVNTAGAIVGCLLAGFVLIERLGLRGTTHVAAATNLLLAVVALWLARTPTGAARPAGHEHVAAAGDLPGVSPGIARLVLGCAGLSGFVALAAEVLWSRALLRYLYNSTYAFTTMLATFLFGIALGSALFSARLARTRRPLLLLAGLLTGVGCGLALSSASFPYLRTASTTLLLGDAIVSFDRALALMFVRAGMILVLPTIFLGALLPLATALCARAPGALGRTVGRVYAVNTLGAIAGSLAASFLLIPGLGMLGTSRLLVGLSLGGAAVVAAAAAESTRTRVLSVVAGAVVIALYAGIANDDVFKRTFVPDPRIELVYYAEGATDTVGVSQFYGQRTILYEDQRGTASTTTYGINFMLGHLPMLLHPGRARHALHICFGVGNSLSAVAAHEELERVDNVELSPHVLEAGPYFWTNDGVLENPKVRTIINDGRNFLMTTHEMYDVIVMEPPETFTAGVINLYTVEFYREALAHLAPDGVMLQWIPTGQAPMDDERRLLAAFAQVFPHRTMWWQMGGGTVLLIGTREPLRIDYQRLRTHMAEPQVARDMALSQIRGADHLLSMFIFDDEAFAGFVRGATPTTDDRTVLDFSMPRYVGSGFGLGQFNPTVHDRALRNPFTIVGERKRAYEAMRRSVVPLLTNLGADTPAEVTQRIADAVALPFKAKWYSERDWPSRTASIAPAPPEPQPLTNLDLTK